MLARGTPALLAPGARARAWDDGCRRWRACTVAEVLPPRARAKKAHRKDATRGATAFVFADPPLHERNPRYV